MCLQSSEELGPALGHPWKPCLNIKETPPPPSPPPLFSNLFTGGQNFTTHLFGDQGCLLSACFLSEIDSVSPL